MFTRGPGALCTSPDAGKATRSLLHGNGYDTIKGREEGSPFLLSTAAITSRVPASTGGRPRGTTTRAARLRHREARRRAVPSWQLRG